MSPNKARSFPSGSYSKHPYHREYDAMVRNLPQLPSGRPPFRGELPGTPLLGTSVNKGKKMRQSV